MRQSNNIKPSRDLKSKTVAKKTDTKASAKKTTRKSEPTAPRGYDYEFGVELGPKATRGKSTAVTGRKKATESKTKTNTSKSGSKKTGR